MTPTASRAVLRWLAHRGPTSAAAVGIGCRLTGTEARARLLALESVGYVSWRQDNEARPPQRLYTVTAEGRRAAGTSEAPT